MPVTISQQDYWDLIHQAQHQQNLNRNDKFDITYQYPEHLGTGTYREVQLRQGIELGIDCYQLHDDVITESPERSHVIEYNFALSGKLTPNSIAAGQYELYGSGVAPIESWERSSMEKIWQIGVHIEPELFETFLGDRDLTSIGLGHLIRKSDRYYQRCGTTTIAMQTVLHQILHCPFQDITKKIYLESKVWELMALLIEEEQEQRQCKHSHAQFTLKPDDVERIHYAKEILY